jgi:hypothetical protein
VSFSIISLSASIPCRQAEPIETGANFFHRRAPSYRLKASNAPSFFKIRQTSRALGATTETQTGMIFGKSASWFP